MTTMERIREAIEAALHEARADDLALEELERHVVQHVGRKAPTVSVAQFTVADRLNFTGWQVRGSCEGAPFYLAA